MVVDSVAADGGGRRDFPEQTMANKGKDSKQQESESNWKSPNQMRNR